MSMTDPTTATTWPSVSVIIPAYNQAGFVTAALDAVAAQEYPGELEVIVVDDGSPDDVSEVAEAHPINARVIRQENMGVSGARNTGMREATGEYFAFLDADDRWLPGKLVAQVEALLALRRPALSFTRYRRVDGDGTSPEAAEHPSRALVPNHADLAFRNFIGTSTVVVHRECIARTGQFPTREVLQKGGQDYALWLRIASLFPLVYVPEVYTLYTIHEVNRVGTDPIKHYQGGLNALEDFDAWAPDRFSPMTHATRRSVWAWRSAKLVKDLLWRRREYPDGALGRAPSAIAAAFPRPSFLK